ncbi:hypothetical protein LG634_29495 [Streptomyces bambusae]|uniref:hypothetical protein n=1 Tax=Streptomyces bambusae TaxID=1550616 RepID=UPI001CFCF450|nr:hypothetical protein [Streptomyces bambusae]MCB5168938.1 hypothetical protein [Streptomyces bambusae]
MSVAKNLVLTTAGVLVAVGFAAAVAVPATLDWAGKRHEETSSYATGAEAKQARASVPRWLPDDARSVEYAMKTTGGDRLLKATLADGRLPAGCSPAPAGAAIPAGGAPALGAAWFPAGAEDRATARCGLYYAYVDGDTLYGWQHDKEWITENKTTAAS